MDVSCPFLRKKDMNCPIIRGDIYDQMALYDEFVIPGKKQELLN